MRLAVTRRWRQGLGRRLKECKSEMDFFWDAFGFLICDQTGR